ncbi:MAG: serine O-acetyltransferase [Candidatus Omnitrophota bacterium]
MRVSIKGTFDLIKADFYHWCGLYKKERSFSSWLSFLMLPSSTAVIVYRFEHYFYRKNLKFFSRLLFCLNVFLTGAEIVPEACIGGGFILFHSTATMVAGKIGDNVILSGNVAIGTNGTKKDIGAGGGLPVVGDNVKVGLRAMILGPVNIGAGVNIRAGAGVFSDMPANTLVGGFPALVLKEIGPEYNIFDRP